MNVQSNRVVLWGIMPKYESPSIKHFKSYPINNITNKNRSNESLNPDFDICCNAVKEIQ